MSLSRRIVSSTASSSSLILLDLPLEDRQAVVPENVDERLQLAEGSSVDPVEPARAVAAERQQAGIGQQPEMLRGRLPGRLKMSGDFAGGKLAVMHQLHDRDALGIGEGFRDLIHLVP